MKKALLAMLACATAMAMDIKAIVYNEGSQSASDKFAVEELATHLEKALGHEIPCVVEDGTRVTGAIYVGNTDYAAKENFAEYATEEWLIKESDGAVILGGGKVRGVNYAVYEFLERFAGVDWLDSTFTYIPKLKEIDIPAGTKLRGKPSVQYRSIYTYYAGDGNKGSIRFKARNRENVFLDANPGKESRYGATPVFGRPKMLNTFNFYVQDWPKTGFEQFYSQNTKGERKRPKNEFGPGQICFSNKDCRDKFARQMIGYIEKDRQDYPENYPLIYNLSANDCKDTCYCDACQALAKKYGAQSGPMLEFVNAVADQVYEKYPDITIQTSAYLLFEEAPTGIKPSKNVAVRFSPYTSGIGMDTMRSINHPSNSKVLEAINAWSSLGKIQIWNYWVSYGQEQTQNVCIANINSIVDNVRTYQRLGANYIFTECEYPDTTTFYHLRVWIGYHLQNNINLDVPAYVDRFFDHYYGPAARPMREYYDYIVVRMEENDRLDSRNVFGKKYVDDEFFKHCMPLLQSAMDLVKDNHDLRMHVLNEMVPLHMALAVKKPKLPGVGAYAKSLPEEWKELAKHIYGEKTSYYKNQQKNIDAFFLALLPIDPGAKYPIPPELEGKTVYEFTHEKFNKIKELGRYGVVLKEDPDSPVGTVLFAGQKLAEYSASDFHSQALTSGFQDRVNKVGFHSYTFKRDQLPQDEQYHFYNLGKVELHIGSLFWMHRTWLIQQDFSNMYDKDGDNKYVVYISVKFAGPSYVKGSTKEDSISIDRFILARP